MNTKNSVNQSDNLQITSSHNQSVETEEFRKVPTSNNTVNSDSPQKLTFASLFIRIKNCFLPFLFQVFIIMFEVFGIICYAISLKGCNLPELECYLKYTINAIYILFILLSISSLSYITCIILVKKKIIKWYHLAGTSLSYFILFFVKFGTSLNKHGFYNIIAFLVLDVIFFIMYLILKLLSLFIKKKKNYFDNYYHIYHYFYMFIEVPKFMS